MRVASRREICISSRATTVTSRARFAASFFVVASVGCHTPVSPPTPSEHFVVDTLNATVGVGGTVFFSFTTPTAGDVRLTLLSIKRDGADLSVALNLGVGTPAGTGCTAATSLLSPEGVTPQLTTNVDAGVHCASVTDPSVLTAPASIVLNIAHP